MYSLFEIDPRFRKKVLWLSIGVTILILIFYMSLTSTPRIPMPRNLDKLYHGFAYLVLMSWWAQLLPKKATRLVLMVLFIAMGAGIEVLQSFHPLRYFDVADMAANAVGVTTAWVLAWKVFDGWLVGFENRFLS